MNIFFKRNLKVSSAVAGALLMLTLILSSCLKNDDDNLEPTPISALSLINVAYNADSINFYFNNKKVNDSLIRYTTKQKAIAFPEGNHQLSLSTATDTVKFLKKSHTFKVDEYYSIFVVPTATSVEFVQRLENTSFPTKGKTKLRFSNFIFGSPEIHVDVKDGGNVFEKIEFKEVSGFIELDPGNYTFVIKNPADPAVTKASASITLEANVTYTLISGGKWDVTSGKGQPVLSYVYYN